MVKSNATVKVDTFEKMMPQSLDALERYLANGRIKGIGPATASKIIKEFGEETIAVFKFEPEKLSRIKGINKPKIGDDWGNFVQSKAMKAQHTWRMWAFQRPQICAKFTNQNNFQE